MYTGRGNEHTLKLKIQKKNKRKNSKKIKSERPSFENEEPHIDLWTLFLGFLGFFMAFIFSNMKCLMKKNYVLHPLVISPIFLLGGSYGRFKRLCMYCFILF